MYKSKIDIDMHLFGKTLRQIMHDNEINCAEFAANIQLGPKYLTGVRKGKEVYNHAIYVRIVDGLKGYFQMMFIRILEINLSVQRLGMRYKVKERKPARRSAGFEIRRQKMSLPI